MSQAFICDRCGAVFPDGQEGSAKGSVTLVVKGKTVQRGMDQCALCMSSGVPVRQAIETQSMNPLGQNED